MDDSVERKLSIIKSYEESIKNLKEMKSIYNFCNIKGDKKQKLVDEINSQIKDCEKEIEKIIK